MMMASYICALWNPRLFLICTQEQFQTDVDFSKAHISAQRPLCHLVYFSTLQPAFQPSAVLCITFMCHSCFNQYHQQPHVVILNLFIMHCECHHQSVVLQTSSMQSCSVKSSCLFVIPRLLFPWFLD